MPTPGQYDTYYCKDHKITIYYFKSDNYITGWYHCWSCIKEKNNGIFVYPYRMRVIK